MFVLAGCRVPVGPDNETRRGHLLVRAGRLEAILGIDAPLPRGAEVIDGGGLWALPGAIDAHVHFDTPGFTHREDFEHGTAAAAAGGVTTVVDMPCTSLPPVVDAAALRAKRAAIEPRARVDFALWGGASGNLLGEPDWRERLAELAAAGVVGFKTYLLSGMDSFAALDPGGLVAVLRHAAGLGLPVGLHAEDPATVRGRTAALRAAGRNDWEAVAEARADPAEERGVETGLEALRRAGGALHLVHVGSAAALARIVAARAEGLDVTAETCPHFLVFTRDDLPTLGAFLKTAPVVKTSADREALRAALADGRLDFAATDHAPCPAAEKVVPEVWEAYGGVTGVETLVPVIHSLARERDDFPLARRLEVLSAAPARRFGLDHRKGALAPGRDADIVLFDPDASWVVKGEAQQSKARWTPFEGRTLRGRVERTFVRGRLVFDRAAELLGEPGFGRFVPRGG